VFNPSAENVMSVEITGSLKAINFDVSSAALLDRRWQRILAAGQSTASAFSFST